MKKSLFIKRSLSALLAATTVALPMISSTSYAIKNEKQIIAQQKKKKEIKKSNIERFNSKNKDIKNVDVKVEKKNLTEKEQNEIKETKEEPTVVVDQKKSGKGKLVAYVMIGAVVVAVVTYVGAIAYDAHTNNVSYKTAFGNVNTSIYNFVQPALSSVSNCVKNTLSSAWNWLTGRFTGNSVVDEGMCEVPLETPAHADPSLVCDVDERCGINDAPSLFARALDTFKKIGPIILLLPLGL